MHPPSRLLCPSIHTPDLIYSRSRYIDYVSDYELYSTPHYAGTLSLARGQHLVNCTLPYIKLIHCCWSGPKRIKQCTAKKPGRLELLFKKGRRYIKTCIRNMKCITRLQYYDVMLTILLAQYSKIVMLCNHVMIV